MSPAAGGRKTRTFGWVLLALLALLGPMLYREGSVRPVDPAAASSSIPDFPAKAAPTNGRPKGGSPKRSGSPRRSD